MDKSEGLLEENDEEASRDGVVDVFVFVHICFLGKDEAGVLEPYLNN